VSIGALAALAGMPAMSPRRLRHLLDHHEPADALDRLQAGRPLHAMFIRSVRGDGVAVLRAQAGQASARRSADDCERHGVDVIARCDPRFPPQLRVDPDPPAVLFTRGRLDLLDARRVGIIGTRNATAAGRATASDLGMALARQGVTVVSGLARGIDAAAHRGVRSAGIADRAVGVVGNGLDSPYPKQNAELWEWVGVNGLLISEWPPGVEPEAWRFPLRNRILAALCELLVVVESRERGGSLVTVREAINRGVDVMAVPGSPRSRASEGTNQLLVDGAAPVTSAADVMAALGLDHRRRGELPFDPRPELDRLQAGVLAACSELPSTLDMLVLELGRPIAEIALALARLERDGRLIEAGGWFETTGSRLEHP
jgi:DNA processing protein